MFFNSSLLRHGSGGHRTSTSGAEFLFLLNPCPTSPTVHKVLLRPSNTTKREVCSGGSAGRPPRGLLPVRPERRREGRRREALANRLSVYQTTHNPRKLF